MTELISLIIAMILVAMCGGFVAAEFSFMTVNRAAVDGQAEAGDYSARGLQQALRTLSTQLSGAQLGITVTNLLIGYLSEPAIAELISPLLTDIGMGEGAVSATATTIGLLLATASTMIFGELVPKNLAIAKPMAVGRFIQSFQRIWTKSLYWPIRLFNNNANWVVAKLGVEPQEELATARSGQELATLVRHSARQGTLPSHSAQLVAKTLAFGDRRARDVMTPQPDIKWLEPTTPVDQLVRHAQQTGHSRFPVIEILEEGMSKKPVIRGVAHVRHGLHIPFEDRASVSVSTIMSAPMVASEAMMLDDLMEQLRDSEEHMALVLDEFDNLSGLVTFEDLVEEIVGEVHDEHDSQEATVVKDSEGRWVLPGRMPVRDASAVIGAQLPLGDDYSSIGGLITFQLSRFAQPEDEITLTTTDEEGAPGPVLRLRVTQTSAHRVEEAAAWQLHTPGISEEGQR